MGLFGSKGHNPAPRVTFKFVTLVRNTGKIWSTISDYPVSNGNGLVDSDIRLFIANRMPGWRITNYSNEKLNTN